MKQNKYKIQKNTCVQLKTTEINRHITKLGIYIIYIYIYIYVYIYIYIYIRSLKRLNKVTKSMYIFIMDLTTNAFQSVYVVSSSGSK